MFDLLQDYSHRVTLFSTNVKLYLVALALNSIGIGMYDVIYNLYLKQLHLNEAFVGQSISLKAWAAFWILLPAGIFSDRLGRRKSMIFGAVFLGLFYATTGFLENGQLILTVAFINGLVNAFFMVAQSPFMMENTSAAERMHLFSVNAALMTGAWMLGNLFGGIIPDILSHWFTTLVSMKVTLVISGFFILGASLPLLKIREQQPVERRGFSQIVDVFRDKRRLVVIVKFIIPSVLVGFGAGMFVPYTNLYLAQKFHLSTSSIGTVMAVSQIMTAVASLLGPMLVGKIGRVKAIFTLQMVSLPFLLVMALTGNVYFGVLALLLRGTLMNAANPLTSNLMMEEVEQKVKGMANSLTQMSFQLGWAVMGPISGMMIAKAGYTNIFILAMIFYLGSALSYYMFFKHIDKRIVIAQ